MEKFNEMNHTQQCLLVGKVARRIDDGMSIPEIALSLRKNEELIREVVGIINVARIKQGLH